MKSELDIGRNERMERHRRLKEERLMALEEVRGNIMKQRQEMAMMAAAHSKKK